MSTFILIVFIVSYVSEIVSGGGKILTHLCKIQEKKNNLKVNIQLQHLLNIHENFLYVVFIINFEFQFELLLKESKRHM